MINVAELARRLSEVVGRPAGAGVRLAGADVLDYLRGRTPAAQAAFELEHGAAVGDAIDGMLATLPRLVAEERLVRRNPGFVRYFEALPRIVYMTSRGYAAEEIAGSMSFLATDYGVEAVLRIVADAIAKRLAKAGV
jgi:hypothetical protein